MLTALPEIVLAVPFTLWIFGPTWLLIGTIILVIVLSKLDRTA